jgi:uncharacterized protein (DUF1015 family)
MPDLRPFPGLRYAPLAGEPAALVAPPYDVIDPPQHAELCRRSDYNIVHLTLGCRESPHADMPDDWYGQAAEQLRAWQDEGVFVADAAPTLYIYTQAFDHEGSRRRRKLLVGALKLEPYDKGIVLPHEKTMAGPKADRLRLMQTTHANLSPILGFLPDHDGRVNALLDALDQPEPAVAFTDHAGIAHELRCVTDEQAHKELRHTLAPLPFYIADGHHRYETALAYQHLQAASRPGDGERPWDFLLTACMSSADPGMVIRPTHRVVAWEGEPSGQEALAAAGEWFDIEPLDDEGLDAALAATCLEPSHCGFVTYVGDAQPFARLVLRDGQAMDASPHPPGSPVRSLPAAVFAHGFVRRVVGETATIRYTADPLGAVASVGEGSARLAGLLPAVRPETLMAVVDAGGRMPPKSTYFWPKPLTGLVMRSLEEGVESRCGAVG